jgi:hypothetical protein
VCKTSISSHVTRELTALPNINLVEELLGCYLKANGRDETAPN